MKKEEEFYDELMDDDLDTARGCCNCCKITHCVLALSQMIFSLTIISILYLGYVCTWMYLLNDTEKAFCIMGLITGLGSVICHGKFAFEDRT